MSTQEKADNELDDWFKKSLEEPDIPFDPQAWEAMQIKLEKHRSDRVAYWVFFGLLALLVVSIGVSVWFLPPSDVQNQVANRERLGQATVNKLSDDQRTPESPFPTADKNQQKKAQPTEADQPTITAKPAPVRPMTGESGTAEGSSETVTEPGIETEKDARPAASKLPQESVLKPEKDNKDLTVNALPTNKRQKRIPKEKAEKEDRSPTSDVVTSTLPGSKRVIRSKQPSEQSFEEEVAHSTERKKSNVPDALRRKKEKRSGKQLTLNDGDGRTPKQLTKRQNSGDGKESVGEGIERKSEEGSTADASLLLGELSIHSFQLMPIYPRALALQRLLSQQPEITPEVPKEDNPNLAKKRSFLWLNKLSLTMTVAPDLTTVGFTRFTRPGISEGLSLSYRFNQHLSLSVGGLYSTKRYYAGPKDYTPPNPWPHVPDRVNGTCQVIDLPINLKYYTLQNERYAVFLSGGLSSYLMQKEHYQYEFATYTRSWDAPKRSQHWLGVLNISAGYEKKLSDRLSLQIEPYFKLPLTGVGAGKVKLSTTGAFFSLSYRLRR